MSCYGVVFAGVAIAMISPVLADTSLALSPHDLLLSTTTNGTVKLLLRGALNHSARVVFRVSDESVLKPLPDVIVGANGTWPRDVHVSPVKRGHCMITANVTDSLDVINVEGLYVRVNVLESFRLNTLAGFIGWVYFAAWTCSFYPQIYTNFRRKSVVGLNFDFLALNLIGFTFYSIFNLSLFYSSTIQDIYFQSHRHGLIPVAFNDVVFAVHAAFACLLTAIQCCVYERGEQKVSGTARSLLLLFLLVVVVTLALSLASVISWLSLLYVISYIKLFITVVKYIPQAWQNYRRRSTDGWSIGNVLLDFTGGLLSVLQMFVDAFNYSDWSSIFGNPTKFGLGSVSILFDILFIVQHYCLYRNSAPYEVVTGVDVAA